MKICSVCNQTYVNEEQNYCLSDGSVLKRLVDKAAPKVFMNPPAAENQTNWQNAPPLSPWQNQSMQSNQPLVNPAFVQGANQTLPTVSIALGVLSVGLLCCFGSFPFGLAALITGYLGLRNNSRDPSQFGGRGLAIAGLILGGISLITSFIFLVLWILGAVLR